MKYIALLAQRHINKCRSTSTHVNVQTLTHTNTYTQTHIANTHIHILHIQIHIHTFTLTQTDINTQTHTQTYTQTHTYEHPYYGQLKRSTKPISAVLPFRDQHNVRAAPFHRRRPTDVGARLSACSKLTSEFIFRVRRPDTGPPLTVVRILIRLASMDPRRQSAQPNTQPATCLSTT